MRILITGSAGFIGNAVKLALSLRGHETLGIDIKDNEDIIGNVFSYLPGALDDFQPDVVLHLAAYVTRAACEQAPRYAVQNNVELTAFVARECARRGIKVAYASTSEVYGDHGQRLIDEAFAPRPTSGIYGMTKLWGEQLVNYYCERPLIMRPCMAYGPTQEVGPGKAALPTFIYHAIRGEKIRVHRGAQRSWCFIDDIASAIRLLLEQNCTGVYNVGRDDDLVRMDYVARVACSLAGCDPDEQIEYTNPPALQTVTKRISCLKLYMNTGWEPKVDLHEGMRLCYEALAAEHRRRAA